MVPPRYVTAEEVKLMILDNIENYETKIGAVRHRENSNNFQELYKAMNQLKGAVYAVGGLITLVTIVLKVIESARSH